MIKDSGEKVEELFTKYITVESISERLDAIDDESDIESAINRMNKFRYDILGVKDSDTNLINGYIERAEYKSGKCKEYKKEFPIDEIVSIDTPLADAISILQDKERLFVLSKNVVSKIVTRADLQKQPVRLFLFGFISLLEMHLLELIRRHFSGDSWKTKLSENRLEKAMKIYNDRKKRNIKMGLESFY